MASVRVDLMDAKQGRLPPVCICCGNSTQQLIEHRFYYQPTWLVICNLILPAIVRWCLAYNSVVIPVPICPGHAWRLKLPTLIGYALAAILLLIVPVLLLLSIGQYYDALLAVGLLTLLFVLVMLPAILVAQLITPRAYDITDLFLGLTAVSDQFAGVARRGGRGLVASGGSEDNLAGYAQPQPAYAPAAGSYGYAMRPARSGSWKLALIIGGSVLGVVLVAVIIIAGVALSFNSRNSGPIASLPPEQSSTFQSVPSAPASGFSPQSTSPNPTRTFTPPGFDSSFLPPEQTKSARAKAAIEAAASAADGFSKPDAAGTDSAPATTQPFIEPSNQAASDSPSGTAVASAEPRRPPGRGSASRAGNTEPPEGERPEPPIHAMDLRTRKVVFPPNHVKIPATFDLQPGHAVWARQRGGSFWHAAFVASVEGDSVTVRYKGWSDFFNETLNRDMLCVDKSLLAVRGKASAVDATGTSSTPGKIRTWTDITGKYKVEAEIVSVQNGQVTLRKANGDRTTLPVEKLSEADREFVRQISSTQ